jgi:hypothetical protein
VADRDKHLKRVGRDVVACLHLVAAGGEQFLQLPQQLEGGRGADLLLPPDAVNPPEDPERAIIMIATGCGIAPFIGFLAEREPGFALPGHLRWGSAPTIP